MIVTEMRSYHSNIVTSIYLKADEKKLHLIVKDASGKKWVHLKNEDEEAERMKEEIPSSKVL